MESYFTILATLTVNEGRNINKQGELTVVEISVTPLGAKNEKTANGDIGGHRKRAQIPNKWIANEVDLTMIFHPEVLHTMNQMSSQIRKVKKSLTIPRRSRGQESGRESKV